MPIGVFLKNENKLEEMVEIMHSLHKYVPTTTITHTYAVPSTQETVDAVVDEFHHLMIGGDQLTAARARGAQRIRANSERGTDRLRGLVQMSYVFYNGAHKNIKSWFLSHDVYHIPFAWSNGDYYGLVHTESLDYSTTC